MPDGVALCDRRPCLTRRPSAFNCSAVQSSASSTRPDFRPRCDGRLGSAVLFHQGVPEFAHMPHRITRGCKSIMRADVLYKFSSKAAADVGCASLTYE